MNFPINPADITDDHIKQMRVQLKKLARINMNSFADDEIFSFFSMYQAGILDRFKLKWFVRSELKDKK